AIGISLNHNLVVRIARQQRGQRFELSGSRGNQDRSAWPAPNRLRQQKLKTSRCFLHGSILRERLLQGRLGSASLLLPRFRITTIVFSALGALETGEVYLGGFAFRAHGLKFVAQPSYFAALFAQLLVSSLGIFLG